MRPSYSVFHSALLIASIATLASCGDKAFDSAVYTDPGRLKRDKNEADDTKSQVAARNAMNEKLKGINGSKKDEDSSKTSTKSGTETSTTTDSGTSSTTTSSSTTTTETGSTVYNSRRASAKVVKKPAETSPTEKPTTKAIAAGDLEISFITQSIHDSGAISEDGLSAREVIALLSNDSEITKDAERNYQDLNIGNLTVVISPTQVAGELAVTGSLELNVSKDDNSDGVEGFAEELKVMPIKDLGKIRKQKDGSLRGQIRIGELKRARPVFVMLSLVKDRDGQWSGTLQLINDGTPKTILKVQQR